MEDILIPLIVFSFVFMLIRQILEYKKAKLGISKRSTLSDDETMSESELKTLIREAVAEAIMPFQARLAALEADTSGRELASGAGVPLLALEDEALEAEAEPAPRRARRRAP